MAALRIKFKKSDSWRAGQSLIEVLIGTVVGVIMIMAAISIIVPAMKGGADATKKQAAIALGKEMMDNVRVWSESDWHNISNLATSSANRYFLRYGPSPFAAATGTEGFAADVVNTGLAAYWKLDETVGDISYDFSGSDNNGTWMNGPVSTSSCRFGSCMVMNGSNSYIQASSAIAFGTGSFSVSLWLKATGSDSYNAILDEGGPANSNMPGYQLFLSGGSLRYNMSDGSDHWQELVVGGSPDLRDDTWHHVVWSYDGANSRFYFDNRLLDTDPWVYGTGSPTARFKIASSWVSGFRGQIDDFRVYSRAVSAAETETIYKGQALLRYFYLDDVNRDAGGNIVSGAGSPDPATKKITVVYGWPGSTTSSVVSYLVRSGSRVFLQSDWSGGEGYTNPTSTIGNRFSSSTNINFTTSPGSIIINL
ncbi:MAG TPA: LamG domain-containing protein [Candidatus Paceibacterota bacterium]